MIWFFTKTNRIVKKRTLIRDQELFNSWSKSVEIQSTGPQKMPGSGLIIAFFIPDNGCISKPICTKCLNPSIASEPVTSMTKQIEKLDSVVIPEKIILKKMRFRYWLILVILAWTSSGCSSIQSSVSEGLAKSLSTGISNSSDIEMVKAGIPSYLLMIDGMILEDPENTGLYIAGVKLYSTLANFVKDDTERLTHIVDKSYAYSKKLLCLTKEEWCALSDQTYDVFSQSIDKIDEDEVEILYLYGTSWASNIEAHKSDMNAIANLPKIKATMHRVLQMDESYDRGGAHLYLGVLESLIPPALGGKPEVARSHFNRVIEINKGRHMMATVMFAEYYARILFNRELHDELLKKVLSEDPVEEGLTLANTVAQQRARQLLESAEEYF